jgi:hypothetical protein
VVGIDHHEFCVSARAIREACHGHDTVTNGECRHFTTHLVNNPGDVVAEDAWRPQTSPRSVNTISSVDGVDTARMDNDANLVSPGNRLGRLGQPQLLRATKRADDYRFQSRSSFRHHHFVKATCWSHRIDSGVG